MSTSATMCNAGGGGPRNASTSWGDFLGDPPDAREDPLRHCDGCGAEVDWRPPAAGKPIRLEVCGNCDHRYFACAATNGAHETAAGAAASNELDSVVVSQESTTPAEDASAGWLVNGRLGTSRSAVERRRSVRRPVDAKMVGIPLDETLQPAADPIPVRMLNLSRGGACLLAAGYVAWPRIVLDWRRKDRVASQVMLRVIWQQVDNDVTRFGCEFIHQPGNPLPIASRAG